MSQGSHTAMDHLFRQIFSQPSKQQSGAEKISELANDMHIAANEFSSGDTSALARLQRTCREMDRATQSPEQYTASLRYQPTQSVCLLIALELGILKAVAERDGKPVTAWEISQDTGQEILLVVRVMRLITAIGVCDELGVQTYRSNPITASIVTPGQTAGLKCILTWLSAVAAKTPHYIQSHGLGGTSGQANTDEHANNKARPNPFEHALGLPMWELLRQNPAQKRDFDIYMAARRTGHDPRRWFRLYPPSHWPKPTSPRGSDTDRTASAQDVLLVDVGGGQGFDATALREEHPTLPGRVILQDLPETLRQIGDPERLHRCGVEPAAYDMFTPQPVTGASMYLFRAIAHDWSDAECLRFLANTARAMDAGRSRLLIHEWVLPDTGASVRGAELDLLMMSLLTGMERSEGQWRRLLARAGLEVVRIWGGEDGESESVIEARVEGVRARL